MMTTAYVVVTVMTIAVNATAAFADFAKARFVLHNSGELAIAPSYVPVLGALKAAGALGLVIGLLWVPEIGIAAAVGLVLFFVGAVAVHLRAGVYHNIVAPVVYLALAIATLALAHTI